MKRIGVAVVLVVTAVWSVAGHAFLITPSTPARVDFTLGIDETDPAFQLPALLIDYTVEFDPANPLNSAEGYETDTFTSNGTLLGTSSYTNIGVNNIIGCACTGGILDTPLDQPHFFMLLSSLDGTFEVTDVIALAYDCTNGCGIHARAIGHVHNVPEPPMSALLAVGVVGFGFAIRRRYPRR